MAVRHRGSAWLVAGGACIVAACVLVFANMADSVRAGDASARVAAVLTARLGQSGQTDPSAPWDFSDADAAPGDDAGVSNVAVASLAEVPLYRLYPTMEMPAVEIDGNRYLGTVSIPSLAIELPVMETCTAANLRIAPCRYAGSVYQGNMVIAAHNYASHFGPLFNIDLDAEVRFTDTDGNVFDYHVVAVEIVQPYDVATMTNDGSSAFGPISPASVTSAAIESDDWDLTLFTCTYGGATRYTVRCVEVR